MLQVERSETFDAPPLKRLNFDIECRPLGWLGGDWVHKEVTAIGWCWMGSHIPEPEVAMLTKRDDSAKAMLRKFLKVYEEADMVVGHYIRSFDLPVIQAELIEMGLPTLGEKLTHDTKNDLLKHTGISKSQENLGAMLGLDHPKVHMTVPDWREANRLTEAGLRKTRNRVIGDVLQNMDLHEALMERGLLGPPKVWKPKGE